MKTIPEILQGAQTIAVVGLSDKPDEAVYPTPELAEQGYPPLHHAPTVAVGGTLNLS